VCVSMTSSPGKSAMEPVEAVQLRARIVAEPDDLELRLAHADAIEPVDPERARFIRLQCRPDRDAAVATADDDDARRSENALMVRHGAKWAAHLARHARGWQFVRGFIELVGLDAETFLRVAGRIAAHDPVRHWDLTRAAGRLHEVAAHPVLARARSLSLAGNDLTDDDVRGLARAPRLPELLWLDIGGNPRLGVASLEALAAAPALQALEVVELDGIGSRSPLHRPAYDWDGTLVTVDRNPIGEALEGGLGRQIRWLYPLVDRVAGRADRFSLRPSAG
jgi:uncharacterized protein (TIGR02996 family)